jgi:hypothetical protein
LTPTAFSINGYPGVASNLILRHENNFETADKQLALTYQKLLETLEREERVKSKFEDATCHRRARGNAAHPISVMSAIAIALAANWFDKHVRFFKTWRR